MEKSSLIVFMIATAATLKISLYLISFIYFPLLVSFILKHTFYPRRGVMPHEYLSYFM